MNRFPPWKYALLIIVLGLGFVYALPNIFGDDPAVQVSSSRGFDLQQEIVGQVERSLESAGVEHGPVDFSSQRVLVRFDDTDRQLRAADALRDSFGDDYVVALNLAPATPSWLSALGAEPMVLGLDLQGGVHFLMQVDMDAAKTQRLNSYVESIRGLLRDAGIRYRSVRASGERVVAELRTEEHRSEAREILERELEGLALESVDSERTYNLRGTITEEFLQEIQQSALEQNMTTLRNRVNELGVAEPVIQQQGANRIVVQLPGVQDTAQAKRVLGATATIEYRAVDEENDPYEAERTGRVPPGSKLYEHRNGEPILLSREVIASGENLIGAAAGFDQQSGQPNVVVTLDGDGARRMLDHTSENVGRRMAVVFIEYRPETRMEDGEEVHTTRRVEEVISAAVTREPLGKRFQTTGLGSATEAAQLAMLLRAGALAAPMQIIEERTVGPSLGQDNINQGVQSVIIGFVLVLIVMAVYYRVFGLIANLALTANLVLIVSLLSMLGATLTLPGIAGIVLTVGMAVDANVLIFERIREELRNGNTPQASIRSGYEKAFSTIADANVTTLIAAIVLFMFGTGPIKGFAVTLSLGIVTSMFTAILGTRGVVSLMYGGRKRVKSLAI
ncbi:MULTISPECIES: protein translocase subunit SecD [unclassified Wenzhouxiangella]|uniref:protein translocase subunit SecD n=1 Tax=unclassified Wenzhouxiangella TaxID=2613841 RepID=UPI000E327429|nr:MULTISPECIES: protein translocase subunit SecD [unclassified Wenzhouxiangella]RFF27540.1 protein translocase subunit SecD [Wenzhouxiangella sp. 15181]RFP69598.1 protein translocase subunit SecD [Wenzhouxiangella sp. 15190]